MYSGVGAEGRRESEESARSIDDESSLLEATAAGERHAEDFIRLAKKFDRRRTQLPMVYGSQCLTCVESI